MQINRTIRLSEDGQSFTAVAHGADARPERQRRRELRVPSTGVRMQVERIAEEP